MQIEPLTISGAEVYPVSESTVGFNEEAGEAPNGWRELERKKSEALEKLPRSSHA